uniref:Uncharacterized protein n=1 Tax=Candidatus Methanomethylicus mesodigestus TaxID=1867258 RepID=A0A7C3F3G6_9CREN
MFREPQDGIIGDKSALGVNSAGSPQKPLIEANCSYAISGFKGINVAPGECKAQLYPESIRIAPPFGEMIQIPFRWIRACYSENYRLKLALHTGEAIEISALGRSHDDFYRNAVRLRNELILKDMLMDEKEMGMRARALCAIKGSDGAMTLQGECELRLYETALVVMPDAGTPFRFRYSEIASVSQSGYSLEVVMEGGERLSLKQMGRLHEPFARGLASAISDLQGKVLGLISGLFPSADAASLSALARLMREGRAAKMSDIISISPQLWAQLEMNIERVGISEEYEFLKSIAREGKICIGVKEGLARDRDGGEIDLWFLAPVYGSPAIGGNAIVMEASSPEGSGRATYLFRMVPRSEYPKMGTAMLDAACDRAIDAVNKAMIDTNFRREPIYLPDKRLYEPAYQKYLYAAKSLSPLKSLRAAFIGRVLHINPEQWRSDVKSLLLFNTSTTNDNDVWNRSVGEKGD